MNKRILSILLCLLLVASLLVLAIPAGATPTESMLLKVVADKESAKAGDTVAFQIVMGPVTEIGSIQMELDIPAGLTYVEGSGKVADGVQSAMGFDNVNFEESSLILNGYASAADYASTTDTVLGSFECTVDEEAAGTLSVGLTNVEMGSCQTFEVFTELFTVTAADVTIEGAAPVEPTTAPAEPTTAPAEPTTAPADPTTAPADPTEAPEPVHEHTLVHYDEVPATEEADGVKEHYVCEGENGCGKIFEDAFGTVELTEADLVIPKIVPVVEPTDAPVVEPTEAPVVEPTDAPVVEPTDAPVVEPTEAPVVEPTEAPVVEPTDEPVVEPTDEPVVEPTDAPVDEPTEAPTVEPTKAPATKDHATPDSKGKSTSDSTSKSTSSPKTGDSTNMYLWMLIMLASMVGVGAVLYTAKRKGIFTK